MNHLLRITPQLLLSLPPISLLQIPLTARTRTRTRTHRHVAIGTDIVMCRHSIRLLLAPLRLLVQRLLGTRQPLHTRLQASLRAPSQVSRAFSQGPHLPPCLRLTRPPHLSTSAMIMMIVRSCCWAVTQAPVRLH